MRFVPTNSVLRQLVTKRSKVKRRDRIEQMIRHLDDGHAILVQGHGNSMGANRFDDPKFTEVILIVHRNGRDVNFRYTGPYTFTTRRNDTSKRLFSPVITPFMVTMSNAHGGVRYKHVIPLQQARDIELAYRIQNAVDEKRGQQSIGNPFFSQKVAASKLRSLWAEVQPYVTPNTKFPNIVRDIPTNQGHEEIFKNSVPQTFIHLMPPSRKFAEYSRIKPKFQDLCKAIRGLEENHVIVGRGVGVKPTKKTWASSKEEILLLVHRVGSHVKFIFTGPYHFVSCLNKRKQFRPDFTVFLASMTLAHGRITYSDIIKVHKTDDVQLAYLLQKEVDRLRGNTRIGVFSSLTDHDEEIIRAHLQPYATAPKDCRDYPTRLTHMLQRPAAVGGIQSGKPVTTKSSKRKISRPPSVRSLNQMVIAPQQQPRRVSPRKHRVQRPPSFSNQSSPFGSSFTKSGIPNNFNTIKLRNNNFKALLNNTNYFLNSPRPPNGERSPLNSRFVRKFAGLNSGRRTPSPQVSQNSRGSIPALSVPSVSWLSMNYMRPSARAERNLNNTATSSFVQADKRPRFK